MSDPEIRIAGRAIGRAHPPYIIAELSANHLQDYARALEVLEMAAAQGADAVKLQTYRADTITLKSDRPEFRIEGGLWDGKTLYELYESAYMPWEWHEPLMKRGAELGVHVFSSPFDQSAIELLQSLDVPAYKIASFEAVDLPFIRQVAALGKPLIISTGMADLSEIGEAYDAALTGGADGVALLHCVSGYPTPISDCNLQTIPDLQARFPAAVIGLSDHTLGTVAATTAVALGASLIEKHVTMSRAHGGPDAAFSLEPHELRQLVEDTRAAWESLGRPNYEVKASEQPNKQFRRSLYVVEDIPAGGELTTRNVRSIRPGFGLPPKQLDSVLGRRVKRAVSAGTALSWDLIE